MGRDYEKNKKPKTKHDLFLDYMEQKARQNLNLSDNSLTYSHLKNWYEEIKISLRQYYGTENNVPLEVTKKLQELQSKIWNFTVRPQMDEDEAKRTTSKCQDFVRQLKIIVKPPPADNFEPYDLGK